MAKRIYIHGSIGIDWWTGEGITSKSFAKEFDAALASGEDIEIMINSPGGSVFEGIGIYNKIAANNAKVTTIIDGIAYSMGAVIAMAGSTRKAYKNATMLIHNCSGIAIGNTNDMRGTLEMMDKLDNALAESLAQLTSMSVEEVKAKYMDYRDHTLSAKEAHAAGFLTEIIDLKSQGVPDKLEAMSREEIFAFYAKNHQSEKEESFLDRMISRLDGRKKNTPPFIPDTDMKIKITANMAAVAAAVGITAKEGEEVEVTIAHLESLNTLLASKDGALSTATEAKVSAEKKVGDLTAEVEKLKADLKKLGDGDAAEAARLKAEKDKDAGKDAEFDNIMNTPLSKVTKY